MGGSGPPGGVGGNWLYSSQQTQNLLPSYQPCLYPFGPQSLMLVQPFMAGVWPPLQCGLGGGLGCGQSQGGWQMDTCTMTPGAVGSGYNGGLGYSQQGQWGQF